jgi:protein TonB
MISMISAGEMIMSQLRWRPILRAAALCALALSAVVAPVRAEDGRENPAHVDMSRPHPQPPYPDTALANGEQGNVLVGVYVGSGGRIEKYRVAQSSGFGDLDDAAVESVLNWQFVPATRDGNPVSDWTAVRIVFQLPQPPSLTGAAPASN